MADLCMDAVLGENVEKVIERNVCSPRAHGVRVHLIRCEQECESISRYGKCREKTVSDTLFHVSDSDAVLPLTPFSPVGGAMKLRRSR